MASFLSAPYRWITSARNALYDRGRLAIYTSKVPVISIGNLTVGGNGKTPLCLLVVELLKEKGFRPAVVTRGYGGSVAGPYRVRDGDSAEKIGDEPALLARRSGVPVVIARSRAAGLALLEAEDLGNVAVLDDGLQHRRVDRILDIVLVDVGTLRARQQFLRGELLPFGPFREDRDTGLARVQAVVCAERRLVAGELPPLDATILGLLPRSVKVFRSYISKARAVSVVNGTPLEAPSEVDIFSGIAKPQGFADTVKAIGFSIVESHQFRDHKGPSTQTLGEIRRRSHNRPVLCTEKDLMRLPADAYWPGLHVVETDTEVVPRGPFEALLWSAAATRPAE